MKTLDEQKDSRVKVMAKADISSVRSRNMENYIVFRP